MIKLTVACYFLTCAFLVLIIIFRKIFTFCKFVYVDIYIDIAQGMLMKREKLTSW